MWRRALSIVLCGVLLAVPAVADLSIDPSLSTLTPSVGSPETLSGTLRVATGDPLPLVSNTSFDVVSLNASSSGGLDITLDPSLSNPAAGVLNPAGAFLIPSLFLELDGSFQLTVPNVGGSYGSGIPGCNREVCFETTFQVDTGGPSGIVTVYLFAIPEPGTAALVMLGLLVLGSRRPAEKRVLR